MKTCIVTKIQHDSGIYRVNIPPEVETLLGVAPGAKFYFSDVEKSYTGLEPAEKRTSCYILLSTLKPVYFSHILEIQLLLGDEPKALAAAATLLRNKNLNILAASSFTTIRGSEAEYDAVVDYTDFGLMFSLDMNCNAYLQKGKLCQELYQVISERLQYEDNKRIKYGINDGIVFPLENAILCQNQSSEEEYWIKDSDDSSGSIQYTLLLHGGEIKVYEGKYKHYSADDVLKSLNEYFKRIMDCGVFLFDIPSSLDVGISSSLDAIIQLLDNGCIPYEAREKLRINGIFLSKTARSKKGKNENEWVIKDNAQTKCRIHHVNSILKFYSVNKVLQWPDTEEYFKRGNLSTELQKHRKLFSPHCLTGNRAYSADVTRELIGNYIEIPPEIIRQMRKIYNTEHDQSLERPYGILIADSNTRTMSLTFPYTGAKLIKAQFHLIDKPGAMAEIGNFLGENGIDLIHTYTNTLASGDELEVVIFAELGEKLDRAETLKRVIRSAIGKELNLLKNYQVEDLENVKKESEFIYTVFDLYDSTKSTEINKFLDRNGITLLSRRIEEPSLKKIWSFMSMLVSAAHGSESVHEVEPSNALSSNGGRPVTYTIFADTRGSELSMKDLRAELHKAFRAVCRSDIRFRSMDVATIETAIEKLLSGWRAKFLLVLGFMTLGAGVLHFIDYVFKMMERCVWIFGSCHSNLPL